jgi:hypothetical protein
VTESGRLSIVTELLRCSVYDAFIVRKEAFSVADILRILQQVSVVALCR